MLATYILLFATTAVYYSVLAQRRITPHRGYPTLFHTTEHHPHHHHVHWSPRPYAFSYNAHLHDHLHDDGRISRTESKDASGIIRGSYSLNAEGYSRHVDYVADHHGFRAHVRTNEPGTSNKNPADVIMESTYHGHHHHTHGGYRPLTHNIHGSVHHGERSHRPVTHNVRGNVHGGQHGHRPVVLNVHGNIHHRGQASTAFTEHGTGLLHLDIAATNDHIDVNTHH